MTWEQGCEAGLVEASEGPTTMNTGWLIGFYLGGCCCDEYVLTSVAIICCLIGAIDKQQDWVDKSTIATLCGSTICFVGDHSSLWGRVCADRLFGS